MQSHSVVAFARLCRQFPRLTTVPSCPPLSPLFSFSPQPFWHTFLVPLLCDLFGRMMVPVRRPSFWFQLRPVGGHRLAAAPVSPVGQGANTDSLFPNALDRLFFPAFASSSRTPVLFLLFWTVSPRSVRLVHSDCQTDRAFLAHLSVGLLFEGSTRNDFSLSIKAPSPFAVTGIDIRLCALPVPFFHSGAFRSCRRVGLVPPPSATRLTFVPCEPSLLITKVWWHTDFGPNVRHS